MSYLCIGSPLQLDSGDLFFHRSRCGNFIADFFQHDDIWLQMKEENLGSLLQNIYFNCSSMELCM